MNSINEEDMEDKEAKSVKCVVVGGKLYPHRYWMAIDGN